MVGYVGKMVAIATAYLMTQAGMSGATAYLMAQKKPEGHPKTLAVPMSGIDNNGSVANSSDDPLTQLDNSTLCLDCIVRDEDPLFNPFSEERKFEGDKHRFTGRTARHTTGYHASNNRYTLHKAGKV